MNNLPFYIPVLFIITTMFTFFFVAKAFSYSKPVIIVILIWLLAQGIIASIGFYTHTSSLPPRLLLALLPPILSAVLLVTTAKGKKLISNVSLPPLTLLHVVRIPVEIVLLLLFINKTIPGIMTFEGRNFDIISGITALLVYYFGFVQKKMSNRLIIAWNIICLVLLANIVTIAILAAPFPFQQLAFDQPNIAVLYAPYIWLPAFIVPAVLFAHVVAIIKLIAVEKEKKIAGSKILTTA
jgi:hypothetical protein